MSDVNINIVFLLITVFLIISLLSGPNAPPTDVQIEKRTVLRRRRFRGS